jgi:predicted molibdopterin-dependent oxidoreductase YjgC
MGCNLSYKIFHDHSFTVANVNGDSHNKGYLCSKGRFGYRYMLDSGRLLKPMIKKRGRHVEASWDEAFDSAAGRIRSIVEAYGAGSVAVFASPRMTNEELYMLQKFARAGIGTNNIGSFTNLTNDIEQDCLDDMFGVTVSTTTMDELGKADVIVVMNADLSEENLIAELKIKAAQKNGAKIVTINSSELPLNKIADLWVDTKRGTNTALIQGASKFVIDKGIEDKAYVRARTEGYTAFRDSVSPFGVDAVVEMTGVDEAKVKDLYDLVTKPDAKVVFLYSIDSLWEKSWNDVQAIGNLMMVTGRIGKAGNGIIILRDFANSQGLVDMGVDPKYLPGLVHAGETTRIDGIGKKWNKDLKEVFKPTDLTSALENDKIKALLIFGENPLQDVSNFKFTGGAEFVLVVDHFMTETAQEADVVLPASMPVETSGSYTACDRRVQRFTKVFEPENGMENWQIIGELAKKLGADLGFSSVDQIVKEIGEVVPAYADLTPGGFWGEGLLTDKFATAFGKGCFAAFEVDLNPRNAEKTPYLYSEYYYNTKIKSKVRP